MRLGLGLVLGLGVWSTICANVANAYMDYMPSENVIAEVKDEPYRLFPKNDRYAFTIDADFFKPIFTGGDNSKFYKYDFYHGNGYWLTARGEFKPIDQFTLNLKLNLTHGTSSNGPSYLALIIPMVGLTYEEDLGGFHFKFRLSDINRQTIGTGLFIEDKETDGGYIIATKDQFTGKLMVDGTGSYRLDGGVLAVDLSFWNGYVGTSVFVNETETVFQPPQVMGTLYSKQSYDNGMGYGAEVGFDQDNWSGILYGEYRTELFNRFNLWFKPQTRYYGKGILGQLPGKVSHNYIAYDQNDKPFTNLMDIFAFGDDVNTYSAQLNLEYAFNIFYRVYAETEFLRYDYHDAGVLQQMYFRTGFKFYPFKDREDHFGFLVGNKYLIASTSQVDLSQPSRTYSPPNATDFENKPLFMQQLYFMINFTASM
jgi:hypothetical protein